MALLGLRCSRTWNGQVLDRGRAQQINPTPAHPGKWSENRRPRNEYIMITKNYKIPTSTEQQAFTRRLLFGREPDPTRACVARAYRDLSRTLHGFKAFSKATVVRQRAHDKVKASLLALLDGDVDQKSFDQWHRNTCAQLCRIYARQGFKFEIGQAQKWINMAFKYLNVFGEENIHGYAGLYRFGHVPIDNVMLEKLDAYEPPGLSKSAWSRMRDYGEYFQLQSWIRARWPDSVPLAVEFHMYQETAV
jgi:hypothetical protein